MLFENLFTLLCKLGLFRDIQIPSTSFCKEQLKWIVGEQLLLLKYYLPPVFTEIIDQIDLQNIHPLNY